MSDPNAKSPAVVALLLVQVVLGYERLASGLTKLVRGGFPQGLADELRDMSHEAPGWYRHVAILSGRVSLPLRWLAWPAVAATAAALLMVADFELANGGGFGLSLAKDAFDEGVDLDTLLTGLQLALGVFWVAMLRGARQNEKSTGGIRWGGWTASTKNPSRSTVSE